MSPVEVLKSGYRKNFSPHRRLFIIDVKYDVVAWSGKESSEAQITCTNTNAEVQQYESRVVNDINILTST